MSVRRMGQLLEGLCWPILVLFTPGVSSIQWNTSLEDGVSLQLQDSEDLVVDWSYTLEPQEWLFRVTWLMLPYPPRFHILAVQEGTQQGQPFYVRPFYWGAVRQVSNAGIFLARPSGGSSQGKLQVCVETIIGDRSCCPYLPSRQFWRHLDYVIRDDPSRSRGHVAQSIQHVPTVEQKEDCQWCLFPWRRQVAGHNAAAVPRLSLTCVLGLCHLARFLSQANA